LIFSVGASADHFTGLNASRIGYAGELSGIVSGKENVASGKYAGVVSGYDNLATGDYSSVVGGISNQALADLAGVLAGFDNIASNMSAVVAGGFENLASGYSSGVFSGGYNVALGESAVVVGGQFNQAAGFFSSVGNGQNNSALGDNSFVVGQSGLAKHHNSVVFAVDSVNSCESHGENTLTICAPNGVMMNGRDLEERLANTETAVIVLGVLLVVQTACIGFVFFRSSNEKATGAFPVASHSERLIQNA